MSEFPLFSDHQLLFIDKRCFFLSRSFVRCRRRWSHCSRVNKKQNEKRAKRHTAALKHFVATGILFL